MGNERGGAAVGAVVRQGPEGQGEDSALVKHSQYFKHVVSGVVGES